MAINRDNYTQTVVTAPTKPSETSYLDMKLMAPLIRQLWQDRILDEPRLQWDITSAKSFFKGNSLIDWSYLERNIRYGQQLIIPIKKDQNPFSLYTQSALSYDDVQNCTQMLDIPCEMPCISTAPTYDTITVSFDTMYAWGVRACVVTEDFYPFEWYMDQYGLSREAKNYGQEVDLWNKVINGGIAAPATTVAYEMAQVHPTQYWNNLGDFSADTIQQIRSAAYYMVTNYNVNPSIIMTPEMGQKIVSSVQTQWNFNANWQRVNTFEQWDVPGMMIDEQVRQIIGVNMYVLFLKRSPWMTYQVGGQVVTKYPLWSADMTKEYVAIMDPLVGFMYTRRGGHLDIMPYDCDKMLKGLIDTEFTASGITFPQYMTLLEYNRVPVVA